MIKFRVGRRDIHVVSLVVLIVALSAICLAAYEISVFDPQSYVTNLIIYVSVGVLYLAFRTLKLILLERPSALFKTITQRELGVVQRQKLWDAAPMLICLIIFMPVFSALKGAIPLFNPYSWDAYFIDLDRQIHGSDAWQLVQPLIGYPWVTAIFAFLYHLWIVLIYAGSIFFAFYKRDPALRQQYFLSYFLAWVLVGVLLATVFASVGPCFVEAIVGRNDFTPLMQYLNQADGYYPIMVLDVQHMLLIEHQSAAIGLGRGITAMPSMHVSMAFLFFLAVRRVSRTAAWLFGMFFVAILVGSVHLAYHYAVDGYVAIIATAIIWKLTGWWSARTQ